MVPLLSPPITDQVTAWLALPVTVALRVKVPQLHDSGRGRDRDDHGWLLERDDGISERQWIRHRASLER